MSASDNNNQKKKGNWGKIIVLRLIFQRLFNLNFFFLIFKRESKIKYAKAIALLKRLFPPLSRWNSHFLSLLLHFFFLISFIKESREWEPTVLMFFKIIFRVKLEKVRMGFFVLYIWKRNSDPVKKLNWTSSHRLSWGFFEDSFLGFSVPDFLRFRRDSVCVAISWISVFVGSLQKTLFGIFFRDSSESEIFIPDKIKI